MGLRDAAPPPKDGEVDASFDASSTGASTHDGGSCSSAHALHLRVFRGDEQLRDNRNGVVSSDAGPLQVELSAEVTAIGRGLPAGLALNYDVDGLSYLRLMADGAVWTVLAKDTESFGVDVGDAVTFRWAHSQLIFYAVEVASFELRKRGVLTFAYSMIDDPPDGFTVERGADVCEGRQRCGSWMTYALKVRGPCGQGVEVAPFARGEVCGYEVSPRNVRETLGRVAGISCQDWYIRSRELFLVRTQPIDSEDAGIDIDADAGR